MTKTARFHHDTRHSRGKAKRTGAPWMKDKYRQNNWQTDAEFREAKKYNRHDYKYEPEYKTTYLRTALNTSKYLNAPNAKHARLATISAHLKYLRKGGKTRRRLTNALNRRLTKKN